MIYIGSTSEELNIRLSKHEYDAKRLKSKLHKSISKHGKGSHMIELISEVETKEDALLEELKQILLNDSVRNGLNNNYPLSKNRAIEVAIDMMG